MDARIIVHVTLRCVVKSDSFDNTDVIRKDLTLYLDDGINNNLDWLRHYYIELITKAAESFMGRYTEVSTRLLAQLSKIK